MSTFTSLREANIARQAEWDSGQQIGLTFRATELGGEVGEALNVIKKLERERLGIRGSRATREDLASELADVVICVDLIAMGEGIDLDAAIAGKFNATSEKVGLKTRLALVRVSRAAAALRRLQIGAAEALEKLGGESATGVVADFLAAIHRECVSGLIAGDEVVNEVEAVRP